MFGDVIDKEDFASLGLNRKTTVGADAAFGRHKGGIGHNDVEGILPSVFGGECVVFVGFGVGEAVEIHIHKRETDHAWVNIIADDIIEEAGLLGECRFFVVSGDVFVGTDQEAGGSTGGVKDGFIELGVNDFDDEVDYVSRGSELTCLAL